MKHHVETATGNQLAHSGAITNVEASKFSSLRHRFTVSSRQVIHHGYIMPLPQQLRTAD
jgi:hypothetical protein